MGWNEWPLIIFTVLAQSAVGAFIISVAVLFLLPGNASAKLRLERSLLPIWVLIGLGFLASMAHLGMPMRGANALIRFGQASLSNEIAFGTSFLACGGLAWLMAVVDKATAIRKGLYALACVLGVIFLWNMTRFYLMPTVPTWNTPLTPLAFITTAVLGGTMLANVLFSLSGISFPTLNRFFGTVAIIAVLAAGAITFLLLGSLPAIRSSVHEAGLLSPDMGALQALRFVLLAVAVALSFRLGSGKSPFLPATLAGLMIMLVAEMIGRGVFFALHMTIGVV